MPGNALIALACVVATVSQSHAAFINDALGHSMLQVRVSKVVPTGSPIPGTLAIGKGRCNEKDLTWLRLERWNGTIGCAQMCGAKRKCKYFTSWPDGKCKLFGTCKKRRAQKRGEVTYTFVTDRDADMGRGDLWPRRSLKLGVSERCIENSRCQFVGVSRSTCQAFAVQNQHPWYDYTAYVSDNGKEDSCCTTSRVCTMIVEAGHRFRKRFRVYGSAPFKKVVVTKHVPYMQAPLGHRCSAVGLADLDMAQCEWACDERFGDMGKWIGSVVMARFIPGCFFIYKGQNAGRCGYNFRNLSDTTWKRSRTRNLCAANLKFDDSYVRQEGCKGTDCRENTTETIKASSTIQAEDIATGQDMTSAMCKVALHALMSTALLGVANHLKTPQDARPSSGLMQGSVSTNTSSVCCSALPNQCRSLETACVEEESVDGKAKCLKPDCVAVQYWVNSVGMKLNPSEVYTGFGGECRGSFCSTTVVRSGVNDFACLGKAQNSTLLALRRGSVADASSQADMALSGTTSKGGCTVM